MKLKKNDVILFEGDSTTDCSRDRNDYHSLSGYCRKIATTLDTFETKMGIQCFNRAVSGNTSTQLLARFEQSVKEVKPTVISILIGINDTWRRYDGSGVITSTETYIANYEQILAIATKYCSEIVIIEPILLNTDPNKFCWRAEDLDSKIQALRVLARKYKATYIPMDGLLNEKAIANGDILYTLDGVHPTDEGHNVIAKAWLERML